MTAMAAFAWLVSATAMAFFLSALGAVAVLALRAPARRVRAIELTLLACLVAPCLPAVPGLPRFEWRDWLASTESAYGAAVSKDFAAPPPPVMEASPAARAVRPEPVVALPEQAFVGHETTPDGELELSPSAAPALVVDDEPPFVAELSSEPSDLIETPEVVAATVQTPVAPTLPTPERDTPAQAEPLNGHALVVALYLAGLATVLLLDALGGLALLRVWKASSYADSPTQALFAGVAGPKNRRVSLLVSPRCRQPFTFAWLWPVIVLPPALVVRGKERELRWALAHEWSHIANRHTWGWALAGLTRAIYWPQPFVWLLRRRLRLEQDFIADAQAAGSSANAPEYATFLTTQAATARGLSLGLGMAGGKSELARRIVMLVQGKRPVSARCGWRWSAGLAAVMTLAAVGAASLAQGPAQQAPPPVEDNSEPRAELQAIEGAASAKDAAASPRSVDEQTISAADNDQRIQPFDRLTICIVDTPYAPAQTQTFGELPVSPLLAHAMRVLTVVESDGRALIDARLGRIPLAGLTFAEAEKRVFERLEAAIRKDLPVGMIIAEGMWVPPAVQIIRQGRVKARVRSIAEDDKPVIKAGDSLRVDPHWNGFLIDSPVRVEPNGEAPFGPRLGRLQVAGLTTVEANERVQARAREIADSDEGANKRNPIYVHLEGWQPKLRVEAIAQPAADMPIAAGDNLIVDVMDGKMQHRVLGTCRVRSDGKVALRSNEDTVTDAEVAGKTVAEAEASIREQLRPVMGAEWVGVAFWQWTEDAPAATNNVTAAPRPNLRYSGKSFDEWREVLENDLDPATRVEALKALGKFGGNGMAKEAAEAIVPYIGFLDGDENVVYSTAQEEMGKIGEPALPVVVAAFESPDVKIREAAAHLLARMPTNDAAVAALAKALDDKSPAVRIAAAGALGAKRQHLDRAGAVLDEAAKLGDDNLLESISICLANYFPPTEQRLETVSKYLANSPLQMQLLRFHRDNSTNTEFLVLLMQKRLEDGMKRFARGEFALEPGGQPDGNQMNGLFLGPLQGLKDLGPAAAPALPTILKLAEEPLAPNFFDERIVQILRAIGPAAEPAARPVLERLRDQSSAPTRRTHFDDLLRSWDAAAGKQSAVQPQAYPQPTPTQPAPAQPNPTTTIYAGKNFQQWRRILEKDLDPSTRATAIAALAKFGANGMAKEAAEAIVPFIGLRIGDEQVVYSVAVQSLLQLGQPTLPVVIEALANPDERIRKSAAYLLSELPSDPAALAALDKALDDDSPTVRVSVAEALAAHQRDLERAGQALEKAYETGDEPARNEIAEVLMRRFPPTDARLRIASDYLDQADPRKRPQYLGPAGTQNAEFMVPLMVLRLEKALAALPPADEDAQRRGVLSDISQLNEQWVRPLLFLLRAGEKSLPALPTVLKLAERPDLATNLHGHILQVLRSMGPKAAPQARPALERLRELPGANARGQIDDLLRSWGEQTAHPEAKPQDAQPENAAEKTTEISRQYAGKSFEQWREVLEKDLDPAVQLEAIAAIREFGRNGLADEAVQVLMPLLSSQASTDKEGVAGASGKVLAELGAAAVPALLDVLKHGDDHTQSEAVRAFYYMGFHGDAAAVAAEALIEEAKQRTSQPNRLRTAVHAIAKIHSRPAVTLPFLKEMAQSTDEDTRLGALLGLATLKTTDDEVVPVIVESIWSVGGSARRASFCHSALDWIGERTSLPRKVEVVRGLLERAKKDLASSDLMIPALFSSAGKMGPAAASLVPLMVEISRQDPNSKAYLQTFADSLEQIGPGAKEALPYLKSLRDRQPPAQRDHVGAAIMAIESAK